MNDVIQISVVGYFIIIFLGVFAAVVTAASAHMAISYIKSLRLRVDQLTTDLDHALARSKSIQQSHNVFRGMLAERFFPTSQECPYNAHDMQFVGKPFDFLVLNGYSKGEVHEVIFLEIKTGSSRLSKLQRSVRDAIDNGRVRWETSHVTLKGESDEHATATG